MSRPKGGEAASDCVADVLGKVLDVHILIWKMPMTLIKWRLRQAVQALPHMHVL